MQTKREKMKIEKRDSQDKGDYFVFTKEEYDEIMRFLFNRLSIDEYQTVIFWTLGYKNNSEWNIMDFIQIINNRHIKILV